MVHNGNTFEYEQTWKHIALKSRKANLFPLKILLQMDLLQEFAFPIQSYEQYLYKFLFGGIKLGM